MDGDGKESACPPARQKGRRRCEEGRDDGKPLNHVFTKDSCVPGESQAPVRIDEHGRRRLFRRLSDCRVVSRHNLCEKVSVALEVQGLSFAQLGACKLPEHLILLRKRVLHVLRG